MSALRSLKAFMLSAIIIPFISYPVMAQAEYYLVGNCGTYVCRHHHVHKRPCHKRYHHRRACNRCPRVDVYYAMPSPPACGGCFAGPPAVASPCCGGGVAYVDNDLDGSSVPYAYTDRMDHYYPEEHYYYNPDPYYDPDMATGDDDVFVDPELQISY